MCVLMGDFNVDLLNTSIENKHCVLMGDFNVDLLNISIENKHCVS